MKNYISNILSINNAKILITTTVTGSLLQIICRRNEQFYPKLKNKTKPDKIELEVSKPNRLGKSRLKALVKFLVKNGLIGGIVVSTTTMIVK